jgi:hypothetical protein
MLAGKELKLRFLLTCELSCRVPSCDESSSFARQNNRGAENANRINMAEKWRTTKRAMKSLCLFLLDCLEPFSCVRIYTPHRRNIELNNAKVSGVHAYLSIIGELYR